MGNETQGWARGRHGPDFARILCSPDLREPPMEFPVQTQAHSGGNADSSAKSRHPDWQTLLKVSLPVAAGILTFVAAKPVSAVPAFSDQTGMPCQACHVGGFGPHLTPFGREFKLAGYVMRSNPASVPLSAMAVGSFTRTRTDQPAAPGFDANDNFAFDQGSLFVAGGVGNHFGGFAQITYDGVGKQWQWDNLDLRAVTHASILGQDAVLGVTVNNAPMVQDAWNTTPAWGFPYTDSGLAPAPGAAPLIEGGLAQNVLGMSAYAWIGQKLYLEGGAYSTPAAGTLHWLGVDPNAPGDIHGLAPYGRVAFQTGLAGGTLELGAFAMRAAVNPDRDRSSGFTDRYSDIGLDGSWQKALDSGDVLSAQLRYIHESANLRASCALGMIGPGSSPDCARTSLGSWRGDLSYSWRNKIGATLGAFSVTGSGNPYVYGATGRPDSNGVTAQLDYTPWGAGNSPLGKRFNTRIGVQYTAYGQFNGARHNYDGAGANASDNNTLRLFTWVAF